MNAVAVFLGIALWTVVLLIMELRRWDKDKSGYYDGAEYWAFFKAHFLSMVLSGILGAIMLIEGAEEVWSWFPQTENVPVSRGMYYGSGLLALIVQVSVRKLQKKYNGNSNDQ